MFEWSSPSKSTHLCRKSLMRPTRLVDFRIADTFTGSLGRLTSDEQKAVKTTAFDLQLNPANPGMSFHKLDKAKDKNFWSVRVNRGIRLIVHRSEASLLPQGREARRPAGAGADQIRDGDQSQDREGARP